MKSKYIIILLSIFTAAIIALITMQVVQARRSAYVAESLFSSSVSTAMDNALQQISHMNIEEFVGDKNRYIITKYRRIDELNNRMMTLLNEQEQLFYDIERIRFGVALRDSATARHNKLLTPTEKATINQYNTLLAVRDRLIDEFNEEVPLQTRNDAAAAGNLLATVNFNYERLESVVLDELIVNGIDIQPQIGLVDVTTNQLLHASQNADTTALRASSYRYSFWFSNFPDYQEYCLLLYFPNLHHELHGPNNVFIIVSILILVIVVITFNFAIRTIFKMRDLDVMKTAFINNMTHEIKTPIATIGLACEMLEDNTIHNDEQTRQSFVNVIAEENKRMRILVETILQNSKMTSGRTTMNMKDCQLNDIAREASLSFRLAMSQRGGSLTLDLDPSLPTIRADEVHLSNLLYNLIDNALKYSVDTPSVRVATFVKDNMVGLSVQDHGIGISKEDQQHIFERFYRVSTGNVHNVKGFGIGLNYVANVVKLHNGQISVQSEPGQGSTFYILLPK